MDFSHHESLILNPTQVACVEDGIRRRVVRNPSPMLRCDDMNRCEVLSILSPDWY